MTRLPSGGISLRPASHAGIAGPGERAVDEDAVTGLRDSSALAGSLDEHTRPGEDMAEVFYDDATGDFVLETRSEPEDTTWSEHSSLSETSAPTLFERIDQLQSVLAILRACLPADRKLEEIERALQALAPRVAALNDHTPRSEGYRRHAVELTTDLSRTEAMVLERERKVPLSWLRHQADESSLGEAALAHYLSFQLKHLNDTPECLSRIDLVVTMLARRRNPDGSFSVRPADDVAPLWSTCLPPSSTDPTVRRAATRFFERSRQRLGTIHDVDMLFTSGYYIDVLGYKLALRRDYFDPPILYAAARLNVVLDNWLHAHQGRGASALDAHITAAHATVATIFLAPAQSPERVPGRMLARAGRPMHAARPARARTEASPRQRTVASKPPWTQRLPMHQIVVGVALVMALLLAAPRLLRLAGGSESELRPLAAALVQELHPLLITAAYSGGEPPALLVGQLDSDRWLALSPPERQAEAEALLSELRGRGIPSAMIYRQETLSIRIVSGQVRFVE